MNKITDWKLAQVLELALDMTNCIINRQNLISDIEMEIEYYGVKTPELEIEILKYEKDIQKFTDKREIYLKELKTLI